MGISPNALREFPEGSLEMKTQEAALAVPQQVEREKLEHWPGRKLRSILQVRVGMFPPARC